MRNVNIEKERDDALSKKTNISDDSLRFHEENPLKEANAASFKNRIEQLYTTRKQISKLISRNGFEPSTDYEKFLKLKNKDALRDDVISSNIATSAKSPILSSTISDAESAAIQMAVESMQATEFIQLFLDSYMAPIGSDIDYRLGKVVGIKEYLYNDKNKTYKDYKSFGQYDEYGRIDTAVNLMLRTEIPGIGTQSKYVITPGKGWQKKEIYVVPPYTEDYVNFFFPPFSSDSFSTDATISTAVDESIRNRTWDSKNKKWIYKDEFDLSAITYDTSRLLSMRNNPTYRLPAYKAINDNISFLQHIFEQCTGVVSTYLTEWDISIYIQEGLLSEKENKAPSFLSLTNRITMDNPSNYKDNRAFVYGALNASVSKTPLEGVPVPNRSDWVPSAYPYSTYWLNYKSTDRGDGLDLFYDVALGGFEFGDLNRYARGDGNLFTSKHYSSLTFREKIMRDDQIGAAYSGWMNWDTFQYWQALYTTPDDGLSSIDIVHMNIDNATSKFENTNDGNDVIDGTIQQIISALYAENDELGFDKSEYDVVSNDDKGNIVTTTYRKNAVYPYDPILIGRTITDKNGKDITPDTSVADVDIGGEDDDYKILKIRIKGSRILKMFLKRSSKQQAAMNIAKKEQNSNFATANSTSNNSSGGIFGNNTTGNSTPTSSSNSTSTGNNTSNHIVSMVDADADENSKYARDTGVSQWAPSLYGGPHGRNLNPRTVEGYFEKDNEFLRNVPRLSVGNLSTNLTQNFNGVEDRYSPTGNKVSITDPYRSPSRCKSLLQTGDCDFTLQPVYCLMRHYLWSTKPNGYINGNWFYSISRGWSVETINTGYLTPISFMCNPYNSDYYPSCPHYYWNASYEWNNWTRYAHYYGGTQYWSSWYWQSNTWDGCYSLGYRKDYWGKLNNLCIWATERTNNRFSSYKHYHGTCGVYMLKAQRMRYSYYCTYSQWETYYMKRPLMHSNINATNASLWNISEGFRYNNVYCKWYDDHWWWRYWSKMTNGLLSRYSPVSSHSSAMEISMAYQRHNGYRLTFPLSGVKVNNGIPGSVNDIRHKEELNFMEYVTGNSTTGWHNVYMFQSAPGTTRSDRYQNGPTLIFKVPVRRNQYTCSYQEWYRKKVTHACHTDWRWYSRTITGSVPFIEVDMKNIKQVLGGFKQGGIEGTTPWSNIDSLVNDSTKQETNIDVPPGNVAKVKLPNSPFGYSTLSNNEGIPTQYWPGIGKDSNEFIMFGWGYASALPGMEYYNVNPPENIFENPNDYMNIQNIYGSKAKDYRMQDLSYYYPFYTLDNNAPLIYVAPPGVGSQHNYIRSQGIKKYTRIWAKDPGIRKMIKNLFATSTFFKFVEPINRDLSDYLCPRIVTNDIGLRVLIKNVNHQIAWLKKAEQVFLNSISWDEVRNLMERTVNKNILSKSIPTSSSYDTSSVFYHPWIDKAYQIFEDDSNANNVQQAFSRKINVLQSFLDKMSKYVAMTSYSWSYNDYVYIYNAIKELKDSFVDPLVYGKKDYTVEEFMYSYLNVLYEYRKFYINSRCNKIDGTLYKMRELEGAIPLVCQQIIPFDPMGTGDEPSLFDGSSHTYKISYYAVDNNNVQKIRSVVESSKLQQDRTMLLYIKVKYVDDEVALDYLNKCKNGINKPSDQRYIWVPQKGKYAELPFDDDYRYESKEYLTNEAAKKFNEKVTNFEKRQVRNDIDDCIFHIRWADSVKLSRIDNEKNSAKKASLRKGLSEKELYPYVYKQVSDWGSTSTVQKNGVNTPMIKFDVQSGVDPSKLIAAQKELQSQPDGTYTAFDIMCTVGNKSDYWVIAIPPTSRPRAVGYVSSLKIKSYRKLSETSDVDKKTTTASGAFGYMLYPITEEQANTIPGIGLSMAGIQDSLKNHYLSNYEKGIENLDYMN